MIILPKCVFLIITNTHFSKIIIPKMVIQFKKMKKSKNKKRKVLEYIFVLIFYIKNLT